jgi:hypothetical protein
VVRLIRPRLALSAVVASLAPISTAQTQISPYVVVEATESVSHTLGYCENHLSVRLTSDGRVEWEEAGQMEKCGKPVQNKPDALHSTTIAAEQVSAITQRLNGVDPETLQAKMGPYNRYVDTSVELLIRISTPKWSRGFSVSNPWPYYPLKPLPKELRTVICEISRLRAQVADEPAEPMCVEKPPADRR